ncbi:hypothetical protein [Dactylosporangium sp. NPDC051541]|uniref:hypothetical protein n=1 Tax=Dactylosporangium sp. NPDC051541 TaxID=3363977 RepID=UPI00379C64C6
MDAAQLVARLIDAPPVRLSDLEAVIGPVAMSFDPADRENMGSLSRPGFSALIPRLHVDYRFDVYHDDPERPRDVELRSCTLHVRGDGRAAEAVLEARFGAARAVANEYRPYAVYQPFYLWAVPPENGTFVVEWHAEPPRWALPVPAAAARTGWLEGLRDRIAGARTFAEIEAYCTRPAPGAGIEIAGRGDCVVRFAPPVNARHFATVFGWLPAIGQARGVHMDSWELRRRGEGRPPVGGALRQWELSAELGGRPSGDRIEDAYGQAMIGPEDEVVTFSIRAR